MRGVLLSILLRLDRPVILRVLEQGVVDWGRVELEVGRGCCGTFLCRLQSARARDVPQRREGEGEVKMRRGYLMQTMERSMRGRARSY